MSGRIGDLKVITAGVCIDIEYFAREIEPFYQTRLHRLRIDLCGRDAAGGDNGLLERAIVADRQPEKFQLPDDFIEFRSFYGI